MGEVVKLRHNPYLDYALEMYAEERVEVLEMVAEQLEATAAQLREIIEKVKSGHP
jgi:hypothetical protein